MAMYRKDRLPGGSYIQYHTTWENEAAGTVVGGAATAAGWLVGSSISGLRTLARNSQDRRLIAAAKALDAASEAEDCDRFLTLASDFTRRYPQQEYGYASLALALTKNGRYDEAIAATDRAVQLGLDESEAHMMRADIHDLNGNTAKAIQEYTLLMRNPE